MRLVLHTAIFHISIHAPAEGATSAPFTKMELTTISIHAPAEGATSWHRKSIRHKRFQSTLPRRERPRISFTFVFKRRDFNPRSRGGSDQPRRSIQSSLSKFQSTLPRRERLYSRAEMGGSGSISIHAPAEGATLQSK